MVSSVGAVGRALVTPRVVQRSPFRAGPRLTAAVWACAAALQLATAAPALAQNGEVCECRSGDGSPWWLALLPAGAAGLLGLLPRSSEVPLPAPVAVPDVSRPDLAAPPPLAVPPAEVGAPPVVAPRAPGADTRIPIGGKRRPLTPPPSAYNGPVPRFKVLRQLLGVPESAVASGRGTARTAQPAARLAPATVVARPAAPATAPAKPAKPAGSVQTATRTASPRA